MGPSGPGIVTRLNVLRIAADESSTRGVLVDHVLAALDVDHQTMLALRVSFANVVEGEALVAEVVHGFVLGHTVWIASD